MAWCLDIIREAVIPKIVCSPSSHRLRTGTAWSGWPAKRSYGMNQKAAEGKAKRRLADSERKSYLTLGRVREYCFVCVLVHAKVHFLEKPQGRDAAI